MEETSILELLLIKVPQISPQILSIIHLNSIKIEYSIRYNLFMMIAFLFHTISFRVSSNHI